MQSLSKYANVVESLSEDSIYYVLGKHAYSNRYHQSTDKAASPTQQTLNHKYHIDPKNPRAGLVRFAKAELYPILPDEREIIHRKDWDLKGIDGVGEKQMYHPHIEKMIQYIASHHKRQHDTLIIFPCSNTKPYFTNYLYDWYIKRYGCVCDFAFVSNPGIIPMEYCNYYPYRYYNWPERDETPEIDKEYDDMVEKRFKDYDKVFHYKHYIIAIPNDFAAIGLVRILDEKTELSSKMINLCNKNFFTHLKQKHDVPPHILITRCLNMTETRNAMRRAVGSCLSEDETKILDARISELKN